MYKLKKIVVSVDLSDLDEEVIRYASVIAEIMDADTMYFLHVAKDLNLPEDIAKKYSDLVAPVDETIKQQVQETVDKYFSHRTNTKCYIDILEGNPTDKLLKYVKQKNADLIVLGKPQRKEEHKVKLGRVAELCNCSALFVPPHADIKIDNLVVAIDFSSHAEEALEQALHIAHAGNQVKVYGHHVYHVPHGYYKTGKSYEEFAKIMLDNAKKEEQKFFKKYQIPEEECLMTYSLTEDDKIHDELSAFAEQKGADMILVGSRGRTAAASILLGSVSERLLHHKNTIPLFIVKNKKETMNFLQALMEL